jgi:hypothetical protein
MRRLLRLGAIALLTVSASILTPAIAAPDAQAALAYSTCQDSDLEPYRTAYFYRDGRMLDYAILKVYRLSRDHGRYCIKVNIGYQRSLWNEGGDCIYLSGAWQCAAGWTYTYLGSVTYYQSALDLSAGRRHHETYRLKTAAGNYYYAQTGWLYGA